MLTADKRVLLRLFVCLLAVESCRAASAHGLRCNSTHTRARAHRETQRENEQALTSPDDAPLAVQHEPTLRFHGALRRHTLISTGRWNRDVYTAVHRLSGKPGIKDASFLVLLFFLFFVSLSGSCDASCASIYHHTENIVRTLRNETKTTIMQ